MVVPAAVREIGDMFAVSEASSEKCPSSWRFPRHGQWTKCQLASAHHRGLKVVSIMTQHGGAQSGMRSTPHRPMRTGRAVRRHAQRDVGPGSSTFPAAASPHEVLGVAVGASEDEIRRAFRSKIKAFHPDVYKGEGDPQALTMKLVYAYEVLSKPFQRSESERPGVAVVSSEEALRPWVNELQCLGRDCRYSCVVRAPNTFSYAPDTGRARARDPESGRGLEDGDYTVQLAVGQCPETCIYYVTSEQEEALNSLLFSIIEGTSPFQSSAIELQGMVSKFNFDNNRRPPPRRKPTSSSDFVDWF